MSTPSGDLHAKIGIARADITPSLTARWKLWGAAAADTAIGIHRPLTATALAVVTDEERLVIVSLDVCEWSDPADERRVREQIRQACGVEPDHLLLHSTHTHSAQAPCLSQAGLPGGEHAAETLELIGRRSAEAAAQAIANATACVLSWGTGRSPLAAHRDQLVDGRPVVGLDPDVAADDTVTVGRATDADGRVRAVIVSYACHPTVLGWQNRLVSPDYVGALRELVEERHPGALTLFLQGASGELAPARQYRAEAAEADRAGRALGHSVLATLELMAPADHRLRFREVVESGAPLGVWTDQPVTGTDGVRVQRLDLSLPRRREPSVIADDLPDHVRAERAARAALVAQAAGDADTLDYPVWLWELGEAIVVAHPGEAYSWLATALRQAVAPRPLVVANLTNGAGAFYLPERPAYDRGGYTVNQTPAGPGSLERIAAAVRSGLGLTGDREEPSTRSSS